MDIFGDVRDFLRRQTETDAQQEFQRKVLAVGPRAAITTYSDAVTTSTGFTPIRQRALPIIVDDGGSACHCSLDELWQIWRMRDPASVIEKFRQFVSAVLPGRVRARGCLRFAKVDGTLVTELNGPISTSARRALVSLALGGCFAVEFFGTKKAHGGGANGGGRSGRDFQPSSEDFIIYQLICPH